VANSVHQSNALFQVLKPDGNLLEAGRVSRHPAGCAGRDYTVAAWHPQNRQEQKLSVKGDVTNHAKIHSFMEAAFIQSEHRERRSTGLMGSRGYTPLRLEELLVGQWQFNLTQDGYEPASLSMEIKGGSNTTYRTNLVGINFGRELKAAE